VCVCVFYLLRERERERERGGGGNEWLTQTAFEGEGGRSEDTLWRNKRGPEREREREREM